MQKGLGGVGTLLLLGLGLGMLRNPAPGGPSTSTSEGVAKQRLVQEGPEREESSATACGKATCGEQDLLDTIASSSEDESSPADSSLSREFKQLGTGENSFVLAIVPDPKHTHLSVFFDRTIDAIEQGAQRSNWIFDRASLPWDSREHPESTDFRIRLHQEHYQDDKEAWPGLLIFRPASPKPQDLDTSLFIFLVGETPTGGINKKEFKTAIKLIKGGTKPRTPLRIIGPTFSGSLYSLNRLLQHQQEFEKVVIRSGTVSSWDTTKWFLQQKNYDFATFQQSDRFMLRNFVEFERKRGYEPGKIAVLAEDETAYGNQEFQSCADPHQTARCEAGNGTEKSHAPGDTNDVDADETSVLHLYFPRNISQLRSAYQEGLQQKSSASSDAYQIRSTLPLNLQDTGSDDDTVAQFAHSESPLSQESILLGIIAAIRVRHVHFVVVQATNPMDTLFLSAFLKRSYSEARVVAMPADLLLSRDVDDVALFHGVMTLTTYSLLPDIDEQVAVSSNLKESARANHVFPSAYAAGTYNATVSQVTCLNGANRPGCEPDHPSAFLPEASYAEYGWPSIGGSHDSSKPLTPVVWLTVLGRTGFWPLAILDDGTNHTGEIRASAKPASGAARQPQFSFPWPLLWKILCGFILLLVIAYGLLLARASIVASSSAMTLLAPVKDPCRSVLIAASGCLLLVGLLLLAWPGITWTNWRSVVRIAVTVVAAAAVCGVCVRLLIQREDPRAARIFTAGSVVLLVCFVIMCLISGHSQHPFLYRYVHLTSGVSPLLPFLCLLAGALWWVWFSLSGLALIDKRRPQLPNDEDLPAAAASGHTGAAVTHMIGISEKSVGKLVNVARPCGLDPRVYLPAGSFLFLALFGLDWGHPILSLETRHFERIYALALGAMTLALLCTLFRLLVIWLECRKILTTLDRFPLRRAFAQLHFTWQPIWRFGGGRWQDLYRLVSRQLETLEQLKRVVIKERDVSAQVLVRSIEQTAQRQDELHQHFESVLKPGSPDANEPQLSELLINDYQALQKSIAYTCATALTYLQSKWWGDEGLIESEVACSDEAKHSTGEGKVNGQNPALSASTARAERFVALVFLNFILTMLLRMRTLAITAGGLYIFLLLSVNSYPFEPKIALRSLAIFLLILVVGMVGYAFAQIHRDAILSLVTQTNPGELGIEFWFRMGTFVALPLLSLLVSQFPSLNNAVFSWLEPAANALK